MDIPASIRFGTSSWTYPGWKGLVYNRTYKSEKEFNQESLAEYSEHPLFKTVGIDSTFYTPAKTDTLKRYRSQVPRNFNWVSKVWEEITIPVYSKHPRYGARAGKPNPNFLNAELFIDKVLGAYSDQELKSHTGPFVFQFQYLGKKLTAERSGFLDPLASFLSKLPKDFNYAVEVRDRNLLCGEYFEILNQSQATHCFNHWSYMPPLVEQMKAAAAVGGLKANFYVARILTPLGLSYEEAVDTFKPYDAIKQPLPEMRKDVVRLVTRAIQKGSDAYIIVNNRSEGCSPLTIEAIQKIIADTPFESGESFD